MAKAGELNWDEDLTKSEKEYRHVPTALWAANESGGKEGGIDPLNKAKKINEDSEPYRPTDAEISAAIMHGASSQPTDEEMFGHLVVTEEMAKKAKDDWEGSMNKSLTHPKIIKEEEEEVEWGSGQSFNSTLTDEERHKRNMYTGE